MCPGTYSGSVRAQEGNLCPEHVAAAAAVLTYALCLLSPTSDTGERPPS